MSGTFADSFAESEPTTAPNPAGTHWRATTSEHDTREPDTKKPEQHDVLGRGESDTRVVLVPATLPNGLELDHVEVVESAAIVDDERTPWQGLRRLHVVRTGAVSELTVMHARPLPAELAA